MKAVVISIDDNKATVLGHDGIISRINNNGYSVGEELNIKLLEGRNRGRASEKISSITSYLSKNAVRIAAAALVLVVGVGSVTVYATPCSTVTMDINPSLEYKVNRFERVVSVSSLNDDAAALLENVNTKLKNKKIDTVMDITLDALEEAQYIQEETSLVVTIDTKLSEKSRAALETRVNAEIDNWNTKKQNEGKKVSVVSETVTVTDEMRNKAKETGSTPGQTILAEKKEAEEAQKAAAEADLAAAALAALEAQKQLLAAVPTPVVEAAPSVSTGSENSYNYEEPKEEEDKHSSSGSSSSKKKKKTEEKKEEGAEDSENAENTTEGEGTEGTDPAAEAGTVSAEAPAPGAGSSSEALDAAAAAGITPEAAAATTVVEVPVALPDGTVVMVPTVTVVSGETATPISSSTDITAVVSPEAAAAANVPSDTSSTVIAPVIEESSGSSSESTYNYDEETQEEKEGREATEAREAYNEREAQEAKEKAEANEANEAKKKAESSSESE
ncbi:MAG: hypothetical protein IJ873_01045 [Lachnospiraceae bacterium]|nr:hypothetical protein [Lachnospiraceae bacterium]